MITFEGSTLTVGEIAGFLDGFSLAFVKQACGFARHARARECAKMATVIDSLVNPSWKLSEKCEMLNRHLKTGIVTEKDFEQAVLRWSSRGIEALCGCVKMG